MQGEQRQEERTVFSKMEGEQREKKWTLLGVVAQASNPSTQEAETEGLAWLVWAT